MSTKIQTAIITGASMGIGAAIAKTLSKSMHTIINYNTHKNEAEKIAEELNNDKYKSFAIKADVTNKVEVNNMIIKAIEIFGDVDVLINNAGISQQKMFIDITEDEWDKMYEVNVKGMYNCIQAILKQMIRKKRGKIVNISSIWGLTGASCEVHYSTTKSAIIGLTKSLAKEVGPSNIQVNCIAPGIINTGMISNLTNEDINELINATPLQKIGSPYDVAELVKFLVSESGNFITGQVISPNGGFLI